MTAPTEAYIAVVARECHREMIKRFGPMSTAIICGRHNNYLIVVARGDVADHLEQSLNQQITKEEEDEQPPRNQPPAT